MKKQKIRKLAEVGAALLLTASMLSGCIKLPFPSSQDGGASESKAEAREESSALYEQSSKASESQTELAEESSETSEAPKQEFNPALIKDQEAYEAYGNFIRGTLKATVDEDVLEDQNGIYSGLTKESYLYSELRDAVEESNMIETAPTFALVDFADDGVRQLVIRFKSVEADYLNSTYVLNYEDGELSITGFYLDGYRTQAELYTNGYLHSEGSSGAGMYSERLEQFDEDGEKDIICQYDTYMSSWCAQAGYSFIGEDQWEQYYAESQSFDAINSSELTIRAFVNGEPDDHTKALICVSGLSADEAERELEDQLVAMLERFGAVTVSEEEMTKEIMLLQNTYEAVSFTSIDEWSDTYQPAEEKKQEQGFLGSTQLEEKAAITIRFSEVKPSDCDEDDIIIVDKEGVDGYVVLSFSQEVRNLKVYTLSFSSVDDDGRCAFTVTSTVDGIDTVAADHPVALVMEFVGSIPNIGFSYIDTDGEEKYYSIGISGFDGSLYTDEITIAK